MWWAGGHPIIVLPLRLINQFNDAQVAMIVAHEAGPFAAAQSLGASNRAGGFDRPVVEPVGVGDSPTVSRAKNICCDAWVRFAFPDGDPALRRSVAPSGRIGRPAAARRLVVAGLPVFEFLFTEREG